MTELGYSSVKPRGGAFESSNDVRLLLKLRALRNTDCLCRTIRSANQITRRIFLFAKERRPLHIVEINKQEAAARVSGLAGVARGNLLPFSFRKQRMQLVSARPVGPDKKKVALNPVWQVAPNEFL